MLILSVMALSPGLNSPRSMKCGATSTSAASHGSGDGRAVPRGRKPKLTLKQKVILLLLKHLFGRSNRDMSFMLVAFSLLSGLYTQPLHRNL